MLRGTSYSEGLRGAGPLDQLFVERSTLEPEQLIPSAYLSYEANDERHVPCTTWLAEQTRTLLMNHSHQTVKSSCDYGMAALEYAENEFSLINQTNSIPNLLVGFFWILSNPAPVISVNSCRMSCILVLLHTPPLWSEVIGCFFFPHEKIG